MEIEVIYPYIGIFKKEHYSFGVRTWMLMRVERLTICQHRHFRLGGLGVPHLKVSKSQRSEIEIFTGARSSYSY